MEESSVQGMCMQIPVGLNGAGSGSQHFSAAHSRQAGLLPASNELFCSKRQESSSSGAASASPHGFLTLIFKKLVPNVSEDIHNNVVVLRFIQ